MKLSLKFHRYDMELQKKEKLFFFVELYAFKSSQNRRQASRASGVVKSKKNFST